MIFFIATIFISQIIIVWNIVFYLVSLDKKVNALTVQVISYNEVLPDLVSTFKEITEDVKQIVPLFCEKIIKRRNRVVFQELKAVLESLALIFFKPKYKKLLVGARVGSRVIKKLIKEKNML
ncbi:hypothetical protein IKJ53_05130 [bacterium]|nr:hypothetical protein [bacterium]